MLARTVSASADFAIWEVSASPKNKTEIDNEKETDGVLARTVSECGNFAMWRVLYSLFLSPSLSLSIYIYTHINIHMYIHTYLYIHVSLTVSECGDVAMWRVPALMRAIASSAVPRGCRP